MRHCGEHSVMDEVQGSGTTQPEVPLIETFEAKRHPEAGRRQRCRHQELSLMHINPD